MNTLAFASMLNSIFMTIKQYHEIEHGILASFLAILYFPLLIMSTWSLFVCYFTNPGIVTPDYQHPNRDVSRIEVWTTSHQLHNNLPDFTNQTEDLDYSDKKEYPSELFSEEGKEHESVETSAFDLKRKIVNGISKSDDVEAQEEEFEDITEEIQQAEVKYTKVLCWKIKDCSHVSPINLHRNYISMVKANFWQFCECDKPPRAHHCSYCNHWVMKFDHHWFYIGKWIGYGNMKHFWLTTFYRFFEILTMMIYLLYWVYPKFRIDLWMLLFVIFFALNLMFFVLLLFVVIQTTVMIEYNSTLVEARKFGIENPFKRETLLMNFQETFGIESNFLRYFLPVKPSEMPSAPDDFYVSATMKQTMNEK